MSEGVRYIQERLNAAGFGPVTLDGLWGRQTQAAFDRAVPAAGTADGQDPLLLAALKFDEGYRGKAYPDPVSGGEPWTIGYGHTAGVRPGDTCDVAAAVRWLVEDVGSANVALSSACPWVAQLDPVRKRVLQNMCFNMGWDVLSQFQQTLAAVQRGDWMAARNGMLGSLWAKQVGKRAKRLALEMFTGEAQPLV